MPAQHHLDKEGKSLIQRKVRSHGFTHWDDSMHSRNLDRTITSACFRSSWASAPFIAEVMAGDSRGEVVVVNFMYSHGLGWKLHIHRWSGEGGLWDAVGTRSASESRPPPAPNLLFTPLSDYLCVLSAPYSIMVRQRLISRRGGSRGGSSRQQVQRRSTLGSPSSSVENARYPNTRSRRGRAGLRSAPFPLPQHHSPHTTLFHFRSTLNQPVITATISISFSEEAIQSAQMPCPGGNMLKAEPSYHRDQQNERRDKAIAHGEQPKQKGKEAMWERHEDSEPQRATTSMEMGKMNEEDTQQVEGRGEGEQSQPDNREDWSCLVVEEPATEEFINQISNARWHFF